VYTPEKTDFDKSIQCIQIGEQVEVSLGYVRRESIFKGYINSIDYQYGMDEDSIEITVECMDVKGLLMKTRRLEFFTEKSADAVVSKLLGESPVSSYLSGKEVDTCSEDEVPLRSNMMTDYDLIVEQASKLGFEFFILQGKAYFRARQKVTSQLVELTPEEGIVSARLSLNGQSLVKKIEVRSIDETSGEQIKGEAAISGTFSSGSSGNKLLGSSKQIFYEPGVKDANEAKARAKARIEAAAEKFGELECECVGIPELSPGRFIKIAKLSSQMNRKYYVHYVRHVIDESGYRTYIKAGVSSL
jgi:phage protein D